MISAYAQSAVDLVYSYVAVDLVREPSRQCLRLGFVVVEKVVSVK
jgi:hypothetical protein